jgi:hypothetical protein
VSDVLIPLILCVCVPCGDLGDKKALRLLAAVEKIRKHLSTIPEAHAQVGPIPNA